ncbi:DUF6283 family protein [Crocosphaera sp.]|uniref:DUF6283 family protein n=1 Tax=Crocosphaera sp. TaxID=2729996 RepID=UPI0026174E81|nr:DUF6283 family protein [Crocosphaera sp.]MDJ0579661.1 DUF6283 family protein [Crocosphaera sp.]
MSFLKITKQCPKCPWRKGTNPFDIPGGYSLEKHQALETTIAPQNPTLEDYFGIHSKPFVVMNCHEHDSSDQVPCVGWVCNQVKNNNLQLRLVLIEDPKVNQLEVVGEQHDIFEDTIPN